MRSGQEILPGRLGNDKGRGQSICSRRSHYSRGSESCHQGEKSVWSLIRGEWNQNNECKSQKGKTEKASVQETTPISMHDREG